MAQDLNKGLLNDDALNDSSLFSDLGTCFLRCISLVAVQSPVRLDSPLITHSHPLHIPQSSANSIHAAASVLRFICSSI